MGDPTRIVWAELGEPIGRRAVIQGDADVQFVAALTRHNYRCGNFITLQAMIAEAYWPSESRKAEIERIEWRNFSELGALEKFESDFDVIVNHSANGIFFDQMLEFAVRMRKPFVCTAEKLTDQQIESLRDATDNIPVFYTDSCRFKVKNFIEKAVALVGNDGGRIQLYVDASVGNSYATKITREIQWAITRDTGRDIEVYSSANLVEGDLSIKLELQKHSQLSLHTKRQERLSCTITDGDELAHDILEVAKIMKAQPMRIGFYTLDLLWDQIPPKAKRFC